jgi:hypothetical protein
MRFDVPGLEIPAAAGAIFPDATGRNVTGYDALTFWVKRLKQLLNRLGFGNSFGENKYWWQ